MTSVTHVRVGTEAKPDRAGLHCRAHACYAEQRAIWKFSADSGKGGVMAVPSGPPGDPLREATQRKLLRFSELRGTTGGTRAFPGNREGGSFTCWEICWTVVSSQLLTGRPGTPAQP